MENAEFITNEHYEKWMQSTHILQNIPQHILLESSSTWGKLERKWAVDGVGSWSTYKKVMKGLCSINSNAK